MKRTFMRFPGFADKAVTLSYDDGNIADEKLISIISKYGLKGTFNINSSVFGKNFPRKLTIEQCKELHLEKGNEIAVHGYKHISLPEADSAVATYEVLRDRAELESIFGIMIKGMAFANGVYSDRDIQILDHCGIDYSRTTKSTHSFQVTEDWLRWDPTCHHNDAELMALAHKFIEEPQSSYLWGRAPKLFYLWGHSYEYNDLDNWDVLEEFSSYIGNREDVWYATNGEICRYVKAYDALEFSVSGELIYNPTATDVYIDYYNNTYVVPAGQTIRAQVPESI